MVRFRSMATQLDAVEPRALIDPPRDQKMIAAATTPPVKRTNSMLT